MSREKISNKNSSADIETIEYCNERITKMLSDEKQRIEKSEGKAQKLLSICGVCATIIASFAGFIHYKLPIDSFYCIFSVIFISALIVLAKATFFCLEPIKPIIGYTEITELIDELQELPYFDSIKRDIEIKKWLFDMNTHINTTKLFYVHRSIRNLTLLIGIAIIFSGLLLIVKLYRESFSELVLCLVYFITFIVFILSLFIDPVFEKFSKLWNKD